MRTVKRPVGAPAARSGTWSAALLALGLLACGPDRPPPPAPESDPTVAWARRLREVVSPTGEVDYTALRADPAALRAYVGWTAAHGPESDAWRYTDDNRRLAYLLNALNAVTLWAVVEGAEAPAARPPSTGPPFARLRFPLDGELVRYDRFVSHRLVAILEEPLAIAALVCAARSCPPLSDRLYEKKDIDDALSLRMKRWVASGRLVRQEGATLVFSPALRPWLPAFARHSGAATPCAVVAPHAPAELKPALSGPCTFSWGPWDGALDGR